MLLIITTIAFVAFNHSTIQQTASNITATATATATIVTCESKIQTAAHDNNVSYVNTV